MASFDDIVQGALYKQRSRRHSNEDMPARPLPPELHEALVHYDMIAEDKVLWDESIGLHYLRMPPAWDGGHDILMPVDVDLWAAYQRWKHGMLCAG